MALLLALVVSLVALIITPGFLFYFDVTPKLLVLLAGTGLALLFSKPGRRVPPLFSALLLANLASVAVSAALSSHAALSTFGSNWRRFGLVTQATILLLAWLVARHPGSAGTILRAVAVAGILAAGYGIAQYFGWDPLLPVAAYHIGQGKWTIVRPPGTLGYASYFATWLLCATYLSLALWSLETARVWRLVALAAAGLTAIAMLLTGTRAAMLGLVAGAALYLYRTGFRVTRRMAATAALVLLAGVAFYFSSAGWNLRSRARWFAEDPWGGARPALWRDSLRMAAGRLAFGYGPEVFTGTFPAFESKTLAEAYPDFSSESPHNIFLDALVSQGIPGLAILCGLCFLGLKKPVSPAAPWLAAALAAGIVSQFFTVFTIPTALMFYVTIGLSAGLATEIEKQHQRRWLRVAATLPVSLALLYLAARFTLADHSLALARRTLEAGDFPAAARQYAFYERIRLPGTSADLWYSRALLVLMQKPMTPAQQLQVFPESAAAALRATRTAEDPFNAWYNLAGVYAIENNATGAERSLRQAIALNPTWFKPHWALARLLRLENRADEAGREAALAAELNAGKNPEVARTLREIREQSVLLHR